METTSADAKKELSALEQAAEDFGVEHQYWDIFGKQHEAPEDVLKAILGSLCVDASSTESVKRAVEERQRRDWSQLLPAVVVVSQPEASFAISLSASSSNGKATVLVECEDGSRRQLSIALDKAPILADVELRSGKFVRKQVSIGSELPLGYHKMTLSVEGGPSSSARLIVAPDRAYQPEWMEKGKGAGIAISLYGVRSDRNWGCGDCTDLQRLVDWAARLGVGFVALNPLHAIANRQPYNTSPYLPNSIFYRNHIYLDVEKIEDFAASSWAHRLFHSERVQKALADLRNAKYVEYEGVSRVKLEFLKVLFLNFVIKEYRRDSQRAKEFKAYIDREGELLDKFAIHSALDEWIHKSHKNVWNWRSWPEAYQDPQSAETLAFTKSHWRSILLHKYIQWQLELQFNEAQQHAIQRGLKIGLYNDLALATDRFGSDLWAHRPFYAVGCRVGSPPDDFSPKGQDWGFPPPNSVQHLKDGYQLFADSIRKASAHGGALRIDHVMRFFRLYWIPDGMETSEGTYVKDRYEDLIRILALESVRRKFVVIGEDLGTVPDYVRETLQKFGILSYRLFYFEQDRNGRFRRPDEYPRQALVSATTHDLPTLAGFWQHADIEARREAGVLPDDASYHRAVEERMAEKQKMLDLLRELHLLPDWFPGDVRAVHELTGELHNAIVGFLAETPSQLFVLNQEDLFKDTEQQNLPGTTAESPNWRHKMKYKLEELGTPALAGYSRMFRAWLERTGRI
jgi:4-alpha-glucanotransferase